VHNRFKHVNEKFWERLATALPGTSSMESKSSIVNWANDNGRICLPDIFLEGIFHSKQFEKVSSILFSSKTFHIYATIHMIVYSSGVVVV
jgi:hypothetical protein